METSQPAIQKLNSLDDIRKLEIHDSVLVRDYSSDREIVREKVVERYDRRTDTLRLLMRSKIDSSTIFIYYVNLNGQGVFVKENMLNVYDGDRDFEVMTKAHQGYEARDAILRHRRIA